MKIFISGACKPDNIYSLVDPTIFSEAEFEEHVKAALGCVYSHYHCIPFRGTFDFNGDAKVADLALIHKNFTHWFILEVELAHHSLFGHVIPQVRCFEFGTARDSCAELISRHVPDCSLSQARTLLSFVPRSVAVIVNRVDPEWVAALRAVNVQIMGVSVFRTESGGYALETEGSLNVPHESLGFFMYDAPNRTIRVSRACGLPEGTVQIEDPFGIVGSWTVRATAEALWVTKNVGDPGIEDNAYLQLLRTWEGKLTLQYCPV